MSWITSWRALSQSFWTVRWLWRSRFPSPAQHASGSLSWVGTLMVLPWKRGSTLWWGWWSAFFSLTRTILQPPQCSTCSAPLPLQVLADFGSPRPSFCLLTQLTSGILHTAGCGNFGGGSSCRLLTHHSWWWQLCSACKLPEWKKKRLRNCFQLRENGFQTVAAKEWYSNSWESKMNGFKMVD